MPKRVFSIGHSVLGIDRFLSLLFEAGITAVADVRTSPRSSRAPWYNREQLENELAQNGIEYRFLGKELGGRPSSHALYRDGVADYRAMSRTTEFNNGIKRVLTGAREHVIAMLCSERDPLHCHRCLLVARALTAGGVEVIHIGHDGSLETQNEAELRLLREEGMEADTGLSLEYRLDRAYDVRNRRVAYSIGKRAQELESLRLLD